jgi:hypothetical protein
VRKLEPLSLHLRLDLSLHPIQVLRDVVKGRLDRKGTLPLGLNHLSVDAKGKGFAVGDLGNLEVEGANGGDQRFSWKAFVQDGNFALSKGNRASEEGGQEAKKLLFRGAFGWEVWKAFQQIPGSVSVLDQAKDRLFEHNAFPSYLSSQEGEELGFQKQTLRREKVKGQGAVLDSEIFKNDSHATPKAEPRTAERDLSPERAGESALNEVSIKVGVDQMVSGQNEKSKQGQNGNEDPEPPPSLRLGLFES